MLNKKPKKTLQVQGRQHCSSCAFIAHKLQVLNLHNTQTIFAASYHVKRDRTSTKCLSKQSPLFFQTEKGLLWVNLRSKQHLIHKLLLLWSNLKGKISRKDSAQCARQLILLEKWGVKSSISSMQSQLLGTISSHSRVKLVSFCLQILSQSVSQPGNSTFSVLKWLIFRVKILLRFFFT